jgi:hypothetical protein
MRPEEFKEVLDAKPFKPFTARFGSGHTIEVRHPEWVAMSPSGRTAIAFDPDYDERGDRFQVIDIMLVESLDVRSRRANGKKKSNGKKKKG